jgi:hypothetical protein
MFSDKEMISMKTIKAKVIAIAYVVIALSLQACAIGTLLVPKSADPVDLKGTYTLILYGCRYPNDLENMAFIVDESSPYPLDIYALDAMYKTKKGLTGPQALSEGNQFIRCGINPVWQSVLRKIPDGAGKPAGYELKPLYRDVFPSEALMTSYTLMKDKIIAYVKLDYSLQYKDNGGSNDHSDSSP